MRHVLARLLVACSFVSGLVFAASMVAGLVLFPAAPVRVTADGFRDKAGNVRTAADYRSFRQWRLIMTTSGAVTFAMALTAVVLRRGERRGFARAQDEARRLDVALSRVERLFPKSVAELRDPKRRADARDQQNG